MRKTFMGVRLKTLREQRGWTQAVLAQKLDLSTSYLNQLENNQRPLSVPVLLRLQASLGVDLQFFSEDEEARLTAQLREAVSDTGMAGEVPLAELRAVAQQSPALANALIRLSQRARQVEDRLGAVAAGLDGRDGDAAPGHPQPHEEVRDFFYAHQNHMAALDDAAEQLHAELARSAAGGFLGAQALARSLEERLQQHHRITLQVLPDGAGELLRRYDATTRTLAIAADAAPGQRAFQCAAQLAHLEAAGLIESLADQGGFSGAEARALARIGLASYFAGALVLPYGRFLAEAEAVAYDIERLARHFGVSDETVCHRLSTLQRPSARGVPFFFVRVDRAGNISKRQSATDFHFSRTGGTCPLWNVYEAFAQPDQVLTQLAQMPDGRTYLWIARCITRRGGGYGAPGRRFALGLGCDLRHAPRLVYAKGLDLSEPSTATPIGAGCKVCDRQGCPQRAFPALGRRLQIDQNVQLREPYAAAGTPGDRKDLPVR